jgi:hypothetical protein
MKKHFFFVLNSKGKIELTPQELDQLLDDIYNEGYRDGSVYNRYIINTTPTWEPSTATPYWEEPFKWITTTTTACSTED